MSDGARAMLPTTGDRFGRLLVIGYTKGAKNKHPKAWCVCDCGNHRWVRQTDLRTGKVTECARCALLRGRRARPKADPDLKRMRDTFSAYKCSARVKGLVFDLPTSLFEALYLGNCKYCGAPNARGIDRVDNSCGYLVGNAVSCCATCNYAKRDMPVGAFIAWADRVHRHNNP